jgi:PPOX class probable F420-dependent enzyme
MATTEAIDSFLSEVRNIVVAGIARSGRPVMTPNWFHWDGERFYVSTTRDRVKYRMFRRDPRAQLLVDDSTGFRAVIVNGTAEFWEDLDQTLPYFRTIRAKHGRPPQDDAAMRKGLEAEDRVLLVIVPDAPPSEWRASGL